MVNDISMARALSRLVILKRTAYDVSIATINQEVSEPRKYIFFVQNATSPNNDKLS